LTILPRFFDIDRLGDAVVAEDIEQFAPLTVEPLLAVVACNELSIPSLEIPPPGREKLWLWELDDLSTDGAVTLLARSLTKMCADLFDESDKATIVHGGVAYPIADGRSDLAAKHLSVTAYDKVMVPRLVQLRCLWDLVSEPSEELLIPRFTWRFAFLAVELENELSRLLNPTSALELQVGLQ